MSKVKSRKEVMLTKWDKDTGEMICACLFKNPICNSHKHCEELEIIINSYDDIESVCKNTRRKYKRVNHRVKQISY